MQRTNPFYHRGPIHDPRYFRDRVQEIAQARHLLGLGQSVSIVGPRRIGKSSLLLQLARANTAAGDCYVYFNCEGWSAVSPGALHTLLIEAMAGTLGESAPLFVTGAKALPYREFRAAILDATSSGRRLVFLFDEFESLSANPHLDAAFFSGLRALATTGRVAFVTASARSLGWLTFAEPTALSSPFFNIFTQINLNPFNRDDAVALIRDLAAEAGMHLAGDTVDRVLHLTGPHPFFVQIAAFYAFDHADPATGALTPAAAAQVRSDFLAQAADHWRYAWRDLPPVDRKQLAITADLAAAPPSLLRRLRDLALLADEADGPHLLSPELAAFFARQPVEGLLQAPPFAIDEAQRRVFLEGRVLDVHGLEYDLLLLLAANPGKVVGAGAIQAVLWPQDNGDVDNLERLKSVVKGLRRKLGAQDHLLQNERGVGYALAAERLEPE